MRCPLMGQADLGRSRKAPAGLASSFPGQSFRRRVRSNARRHFLSNGFAAPPTGKARLNHD
jgi:hypothetical protein